MAVTRRTSGCDGDHIGKSRRVRYLGMARLKPHVNKSRTLIGCIVFSNSVISFGCSRQNSDAAMAQEGSKQTDPRRVCISPVTSTMRWLHGEIKVAQTPETLARISGGSLRRIRWDCGDDAFQNGWSKAARALSSQDDSKSKSEESGQSEDATMRVAGSLAHLAGRKLSFEKKKKAGLAVHYAFGTVMGGLYGMAAETQPRKVRRHNALSGITLGTSLFVGADEVAVAKLGLAAGPGPVSSHLYGLASHLVYGLTTGLVYSEIRKRL